MAARAPAIAAVLVALALGLVAGAVSVTATTTWAATTPARPVKLGDVVIRWVPKADTAPLECYVARPKPAGKSRGVWLCG